MPHFPSSKWLLLKYQKLPRCERTTVSTNTTYNVILYPQHKNWGSNKSRGFCMPTILLLLIIIIIITKFKVQPPVTQGLNILITMLSSSNVSKTRTASNRRLATLPTWIKNTSYVRTCFGVPRVFASARFNEGRLQWFDKPLAPTVYTLKQPLATSVPLQ